MSLTFTLKGRSSLLQADFYPPIPINPQNNYSLGLIGLFTYNSIPNIEEGVNNKIYYSHSPQWNDVKILSIPTGSYEISDLEKYIQNHIELPVQDAKSVKKEEVFSLKPNNNTLKAELQSLYYIDFTKKDSCGSLLGFSKKVLNANIKHTSDLPVNIIKVTSIRVECNIVTGSFYGNSSSHTLYEFSPTVDPGYVINIEPSNPIYLPIINKNAINKLAIKIVDQDTHPINFRGEEVVVRLELKNNGPGFQQ